VPCTRRLGLDISKLSPARAITRFRCCQEPGGISQGSRRICGAIAEALLQIGKFADGAMNRTAALFSIEPDW
jgi:hypothetical protein